LELMDGAITDAGAAKHMSKAHAFQYRDGLIIALRALIPLRSRTVVAMRIGIHLVKPGDLWGLEKPAPARLSDPERVVRPHRFVSGAVPQPHPWCRKTHCSMGIQPSPAD